MRETLEVKFGLLLTISTPLKPGSVNRISLDSEFESRLLEAVSLFEFIDKAYMRGRELAEGRVTAQKLGLGGLLALALRTAIQLTGLRPILGLTVASITLSTLKGVLDQEGRGLREGLRQAILTVLYRSSPEDSLKLIEGLEATGLSRALAHLENRGVTRSRVALEALALGHLYEVLSEVDTGFMLNIRDLGRLLELSNRIRGEKSVVRAVAEAYKELAFERKLVSIEDLSIRSLEDFLRIDRKLRARREDLDSLLGGVYIAATLALVERWP